MDLSRGPASFTEDGLKRFSPFHFCALLAIPLPLSGQTDDLLGGIVTPGLGFLPREIRELMIYEEPWLGRTASPAEWRTDFNERDVRRRAADLFAVQQADLRRRRIGGLADVRLQTDEDLDGRWFDLKTYTEWYDQRSDELSWQARLRFKIELPEIDAGLMFYYRHRERKDSARSEQTKWAGAVNTPEGPHTAFIYEHELRSSLEDEVMDEIGAVFRWEPGSSTRFLLGGTYRQQEDHLIEQRLEYDTRAGTVDLPGMPARRGYPYQSGSHRVENGIIRSATLVPGVGRLERQLKDEVEKKERIAGFLDFHHEYAANSWFQLRADYARRTNREPDRFDAEFAERDDAMWSYELKGGRPVFTATPLPRDTFGLRKIELENNLKRREYAEAEALIHHELSAGHALEGGMFALRHTDFRDIRYERWEPAPSPLPGGFDQVAGSDGGDVLGRPIGPGIDPDKARDYYDSIASSLFLMAAETHVKNFGEDYDMEREIFGGHLLYRWDSPRWRLHAGTRYETARTSGSAYDAQWTGNEPPIRPPRVESAVLPTRSSKSESDLLPFVLLEYQPEESWHFSANLRQTLQRPTLRESAPSRYFHGDGGVEPRARLGNPELDSSRQTQLVVTANHAFAPGSMLRLRAEAWKMDKPVTSASWFQAHRLENPAISDRPVSNYRFEQSLNGDDGELLRLGAHYAQTFHFLPHPFDQLGAFGSYDYTHSSQETTVNGNARTTRVAWQPEHRGVVGLFYRSHRWRAFVSADFHDKYLISVGERPDGHSGAGDLWVDPQMTLNAGVSWMLRPDLEIYTELNNLTDSAFRMYEGTSDRQTFREKTGPSVRLGAHWTF